VRLAAVASRHIFKENAPMSITRSIATATATALLALPSAALAAGPPTSPGGDHKPAGTPTAPAKPSTDHPANTSNPGLGQPMVDADRATGTAEEPAPDAPASVKAKAYGKHCQGQSKKHVAGEKGTAFSRCVTAMAKVARGEETSARVACATLTRKHIAGQKGTPFSRCVDAAKKLADQPAQPAGA
jgi:hypothetical protein